MLALAPVPAAFVAVTVNVYNVPFASPGTVHVNGFGNGDTTVHVAPPGPAVTVYPVTGEPPSEVGGCHDTATEESPGTADTDNGTPGAPCVVNDNVEPTTGPPAVFDADTLKKYCVPRAKPDTDADTGTATEPDTAETGTDTAEDISEFTEYSNTTDVDAPPGLTTPRKVAVAERTSVAAFVVACGATAGVVNDKTPPLIGPPTGFVDVALT